MRTIRGYAPGDEADLRHVCLLTAYAGGDARPHTRYPDLVADMFAVPYTVRDPGYCFVAADGGRVVGYIVGTPDTQRYADWFRTEWVPRVADRYPTPRYPPADWDEEIIYLLHRPELLVVPEAADLPAHLHVDLLPEYQGKGLGRRLMETFLAALRDAGVPGVHLSMATSNTGARAFYDRCGFVELRVPGAGATTWLGRSIGG